MSKPVILAAAQSVPVAGDLARNLRRHLRLVERAAAHGVQLLLFPELSLSGYELELAEQSALHEDDPRLHELRAAAATHAMTLVVGSPMRSASGLQIAALICQPDGSLEIYTKRRLGAFGESARVDGIVPPAEATVFAPGQRDPLVVWPGGQAAVAICADVGDPTHAQRAAARAAQCYLASMFVIPSELKAERARLRDIARRHGLLVLMANFGGPSGGLRAAGRSAAWSTSGELLGELAEQGEGLLLLRAHGGDWRAEALPVDD